MSGKVYIVGAGPGAPGLITVRGLELLRRADVVLHDRLAPAALLEEPPPAAERIFVGKEPGRAVKSQAEINALMAQKAGDGLVVVRLKGGDPFIFGRGGEEAEYLAARGIDFEVVPGVTAAAGAAAFVGVPLTDRRHSSVVTFVTGREGEAGAPAVDWKAAARAGGTIVIYMGRSNLAEVTSALIDGRLAGDTPVLVVERATLPGQRAVSARLADIARECDRAGIAPPCITIVGSVASLYPALSWYGRLPLFGKSIVITRPAGQQAALAAAFESLGAEAIRFPTIEIVPAPAGRLRAAIADLGAADWVVFTSANGVGTFFEALSGAGADARALAGKRIAAIGAATAAALSHHGLRADLVPGKFTGGALLGELLAASGPGESFLLWRAGGAREELADGLRGEGREVVEAAAYEAVCPRKTDDAMLDRLRTEPPSAIVFSSASTAVNFVAILGYETARQVAAQSKVVSIGPVTSEALRECGLPPDAEADPHTAGGLLEAALEALGAGPAPKWLR